MARRRQLKGQKGCIGGCSMILMSDLTERRADQVKIGDEVMAFSPEGTLTKAKITGIGSHEKEQAYEYEFWGTKIVLTENHWVLNQFNAFTEVDNLTKEDAVVNADEHLLPLLGKKSVGETTVYELHVEPYATLIANQLRIHNGGLGLPPHVRGQKGGGKGGGGATATFHEDPNTLRSKSVARVIDLIGEGEIVGLIDGAKSIFLDETALQNEDGSYNFSGVNWEQRVGTPTQDHISGFSSIEAEVSVDVEVTNASPVIRTISNPDLDALRVKVRLPQLTSSDTQSGSLYGTEVDIAIDIKPNGGSFEEVRADQIKGKTVTPYEREYRIELPSGGAPWDVRVRRTTADSDTATLVNKTYWPSYSSIIDAKLTYPDCALVALSVDAEKFGSSIPSRAYKIKGLIIKVPSNYDPETRAYDGIWDGTFQLAYTNNPAWILYDLLTNARYGLGSKIAVAQVDKWALYTIAQYCDELVDDGFGGTEPRFTFNGIINSRQEAYAVVNAIASAFRGMIYWGSGAVTATQDSPEDVSKLVTPANVIDGMFNYSGSGLKARHTVVLVTWNDPADNYKPAVEVVEDTAAINTLGWRQADIVAFGCTSRGQARRFGKWILDSEQNETELVSYKASFDHADIRPGNIIAVADPDYAGARMGGRVVSATTSEVTVDAIPEMDELTDGMADQIMVTLPDGSIETKTILSIVGAVITIDGTFTEAPNSNSMWIISDAALEPRKFRVLSVVEVENNIFEVSALLHDETKYARVEENITFDTGVFTLLKTGPISTVTQLGVTEYLYMAGAVAKSGATISYTPPSDARAYLFETEVKRPGEVSFFGVAITQDTSIEIADTQPGDYEIRTRVRPAVGEPSPWFTQTFSLRGLLDEPDDVASFTCKLHNGQLLLEWTAVTDLDLAGYAIRFNSVTDGSATWENSQDLAPNVSKNLTSFTLLARTGTYLIKAFDTSEIESINPSIVIQTASGVLDYRIILDENDNPSWAGGYLNTDLLDGDLSLASLDTIADWTTLDDIVSMYYGINGIQALGYYLSSTMLNMGAKYPVRVLGEFVADGVDLINTMESWQTLSTLAQMSLVTVSDWEVGAEIRYGDIDPYIDADNIFTETDPTNAFFAKVRCSTTGSAITAPDGTLTGVFLKEDGTASNGHLIQKTPYTVVAATEYSISVFAKAGTRTAFAFRWDESGSNTNRVDFDLSNGVCVTAAGSAVGQIEPYGDDWYLCTMTFTTASTSGRASLLISNTYGSISYSGDNISGLYIWKLQLRVGEPYAPFTEWQSLLIGEYDAQYIQTRLRLESFNPTVTPVVSSYRVVFDVPARIHDEQDLVCDAAGQTFTFDPAFHAKPTVVVNGQSLSTGDYWRITNTTDESFDLRFYNAAGTGISKTFDYFAKGYGLRLS